ncbi:glycosyltransferase family 2 protein [Clostridia bacterium OttesenSCG-928-O13]|nr:glycosyltransferase family 2 protein [Clostridia bacterium OttesenSCG-928-O13]
MARVAVLIPCYNESVTVEKVVRDFKNALPGAAIYVYDNNSTDDTAALAQKAGATVRREQRQGKGNVIRTMFRNIEADCYVMVDGDDTYAAQNAPEMVDLVLRGGYDMVIGDRLSSSYFTENKRRFHNGGNRLVRGAINRLFGSNVQDIMTGYRAFSRQFVKTCPILSRGFEVETEITIHALDKNAKITSVPVGYADRPEGSVSKLSTVSDGAKVLFKIFHLFREYRPMLFFGLFSALFLALGIVFFIPVLIDYVNTGLVPKFPSLIAAGIFLVVSLLSFVTGVQSDLITKKHRQLFEIVSNLQGPQRPAPQNGEDEA